jgi:hypothetical protein
MWLPNALLLTVALVLVSGMGRRISTNRGSTWDEMLHRVGEAARRVGGSLGRGRRGAAGREADVEA